MTIYREFGASSGVAVTEKSTVSALLTDGDYVNTTYVVTVVSRPNHFAEVHTLNLTGNEFELPSERTRRAMRTAWLSAGFIDDYSMDKSLAY